MEKTIITWNIRNWITVVLMAFVGFAILSVGAKTYRRMQGDMGNG